MKAVYLNFNDIIETREHIKENDIESGGEAKSLMNNILNFEFIFCWLFLKNVFEQTHILSKYLQSPSIIFSTAKNICNSTLDVIKELRSGMKFKYEWNEVIEMVDKYQDEHPKLERKKKFLSN